MAKTDQQSVIPSLPGDIQPPSPSTPKQPSPRKKSKKKKHSPKVLKDSHQQLRLDDEHRPPPESICSLPLAIDTNTRVLTYDFVVRSLRRRLWKAFSEEDSASAMKVYQATLSDFVQWLEEEDRERRNQEEKAAAAATENLTPGRSSRKLEKRGERRSRKKLGMPTDLEGDSDHSRFNVDIDRDNTDYRNTLLRHHQEQRVETEAMIGGSNIPILQSKMNPSDSFIADDFLCPFDDSTYDYPAQTKLPDPIQHALEQEALIAERKRQKRKARHPRTAFRRIFLGVQPASLETSSTLDIEDSSHDRSATLSGWGMDPLLQSLTSSSDLATENDNRHDEDDDEKEDTMVITPLHEAARLGAGDLVRVFLAHGGNANEKNRCLRTALHMCAGGITAEEQKLARAAAEADAASGKSRPNSPGNKPKTKKHKDRKSSKKAKASLPSSSTSPSLPQDSASAVVATIGIRATAIPSTSLDLLRQIDLVSESKTSSSRSGRGGNRRKSFGTSGSSKRNLFAKLRGFSNRRDRDEKMKSKSTQEKAQDSQCDTRSDQMAREPKNRSGNTANPKRLNEIVMDRMDAMVALLSWVDRESGDQPSINAVDTSGRTALHYAAEHGRSDICMAILSNFGVMLTIVDEVGTRTPCEVAAANGHDALAAQLEARALLFVDPYGMDDEMQTTLMAAGQANQTDDTSYVNKRRNPCGPIVPPFRWFITCSKEEIAMERRSRLEEARGKLEKIILEGEGQASDDTNMILEDLDKKPSATEILTSSDVSRVPENLAPYVTTAPQHSKATTSGESPQEELKPPPSLSNDGTETVGDETETNVAEPKCYLELLADHHLERYMAYHEWNLPAALEAFRKDQSEALSAAGIDISLDIITKGAKAENAAARAANDIDTAGRHCQICYDDEIAEDKWMILRNCKHGFCKDCLVDYAKDAGNNRLPVHSVKCPQHGCDAGFSINDIRALLEKDHPEILLRIEEASTDNFVTTHPNFRFCTYPNCSGIVHRLKQPKWASSGYDESFLNYTGATCVACHSGENFAGSTSACNQLTYEGVADPDYANCLSRKQPLKAQRFCFSCGEGVHWPLTCERLEEWKQRVRDEIGSVDAEKGEESDVNDLAHKLWLKANTRPCPACNVPIEKNDGCNHMVCHSCLHEFCWICRKDWKLHSNDTGGFFRCNIWKEDDADRVEDRQDDEMDFGNENFLSNLLNDEGYGTSIHASRSAWRKKQEMKRFIHHYTRWEAHKASAILEQKMADTACTRLAPVVEAAIEFQGYPTFNFDGKGLSFVHNAFFELAECRSTLRHSYAFSFYRYPSKSSDSQRFGYLGNKRKEKLRFERLQSELETITEQMSDIVARSHLRATQMQITYLTAGASEKRVALNYLLFQINREEKKALAQQKENGDKQASSSSSKTTNYYPYPNSNSSNDNSNGIQQYVGRYSSEVFNRLLLHIEGENYEPTLTPYVTAGNNRSTTTPYVTAGGSASAAPSARDLSLQMLAASQHVHAMGDAVQRMEQLLNRSRNRGMALEDSDGAIDDANGYPAASEMWACSRCTYMNTGGFYCAMCESPR